MWPPVLCVSILLFDWKFTWDATRHSAVHINDTCFKWPPVLCDTISMFPWKVAYDRNDVTVFIIVAIPSS